MSRTKSNVNELLLSACKRGDLWMIKTIYLVYLLKKTGMDLFWILHYPNKDELYKSIESMQKEIEKDERLLDRN